MFILKVIVEEQELKAGNFKLGESLTCKVIG